MPPILQGYGEGEAWIEPKTPAYPPPGQVDPQACRAARQGAPRGDASQVSSSSAVL